MTPTNPLGRDSVHRTDYLEMLRITGEKIRAAKKWFKQPVPPCQCAGECGKNEEAAD